MMRRTDQPGPLAADAHPRGVRLPITTRFGYLSAFVLVTLLVPHAFAADHLNGFEVDKGFFNDYLGGVLTRVASGAGSLGLTSKSGSFHAELTMTTTSGSGAYTFHTATPPQVKIPATAISFTQSLDIYVDNSAVVDVGDKWILENSIEDAAQNWTEGSQFDVTKAAGGWKLGSLDLVTGWHTIQSIWSDTGVGWDRTARVLNPSGVEILLSTSPPNQIAYADAQYVGYTWVLNGGGSLPAGFTLGLDNANLTFAIVPVPAAAWMGLALFGCMAVGTIWHKRRRA